MSSNEFYFNWSVMLTTIFACLTYGGVIHMSEFYIWLPLGVSLILSILMSL